jgi:CheY-like chemotaxis protein
VNTGGAQKAGARVLVIDGDASVAQALGQLLTEHGYVVDVCTEAREGFRKACETPPSCIVCNPELPDIDGPWVARRIRTEPGPISKVPFLFVGEVVDKAMRTQALGVGVDVFLARPPASNDEVVAQVHALIAMAERLDGTEEEGAPSSMSLAAAIRGDLSAFPLASLLMMFEMERRSGTVQVVAQSGKRAMLTITDGFFANTEVSGQQRPALEVLREVLSWRAGRFSFQPRESGMLGEPRASVGALVLEAMRLEDEEKGPIRELSSEDLIEDPAKSSGVPKVETNVEPKVVVRDETKSWPAPPLPGPKAAP